MFDTLAPEPAGIGTGARITLRRQQRGLSRKVLAQLVGRSEEWLRLVESGRRRLDSIETLMRLADALRIDDVNELIDFPDSRTAHDLLPGQEIVSAFQQVMLDRSFVTAGAAMPAEPTSTGGLLPELEECQQIWHRSPHRYDQLHHRLPGLLGSVRRTQWRSRTTANDELLMRTYHLSHHMLGALGAYSLGWTAADRAMGCACRLDRPETLAASAWHIGWALLHLGQPADCYRSALDQIAHLGKTANSADANTLRGALYLLAADAAAHNAESAAAAELLDRAARIAQDMNRDSQAYGIVFGPTTINLARIDIALRRNHIADALRIATGTTLTGGYHLTGRIEFFVTLASIYERHGDDVAATFALARAADLAPHDIALDRAAHTLLQQLVQHGNPLITPELHRLVALCRPRARRWNRRTGPTISLATHDS
ncbi:helix-turn-helix domain-containing protein [Nocardia sp. NBC_00511]